jgi:hypothetical protein
VAVVSTSYEIEPKKANHNHSQPSLNDPSHGIHGPHELKGLGSGFILLLCLAD